MEECFWLCDFFKGLRYIVYTSISHNVSKSQKPRVPFITYNIQKEYLGTYKSMMEEMGTQINTVIMNGNLYGIICNNFRYLLVFLY